jgi:hypothetical protein
MNCTNQTHNIHAAYGMLRKFRKYETRDTQANNFQTNGRPQEKHSDVN